MILMTNQDKLLTVSQAAKRMNISESTVRELCRKEFLVAQKAGRTWKISEHSVNVWLNQPILPKKPFYERRWFITIASLIAFMAAIAGIWTDSGLRELISIETAPPTGIPLPTREYPKFCVNPFINIKSLSGLQNVSPTDSTPAASS
jgi:excisionase family DNA binding protein